MKYLVNKYSVLDDGNYLNIYEAEDIIKKEKIDVVLDQVQEEWEGTHRRETR